MKHVPVLLTEVLEGLQIKKDGNYIDCTLGDGGHSYEILKKNAPNGKLLGIDADPESLLRAKHVLNEYKGRAVFARSNFERITEVVAEHEFVQIDGILADLGWSSPQFVERGRGFSFTQEEDLLDMRYAGHVSERKTAADIINSYTVAELATLFKKYGEEPQAKIIASVIGEKRKEKYIETVGELSEIILGVYRKKLKTEKKVPWIGGLHPSTKVFQALRIEVNEELGVIEKLLEQGIKLLAPNGRFAIISFHSIEDRIVKHFFRGLEIAGQGKVITKKPIVATYKETKQNKRSTSAKLRIFEKKINN
mgnify:CR=1 FL=1